jgi:hypothetical protein
LNAETFIPDAVATASGATARATFTTPPSPESLSDVVFDYDQRTSAEDLVPVLQSLSGSASTPRTGNSTRPSAAGGQVMTLDEQTRGDFVREMFVGDL